MKLVLAMALAAWMSVPIESTPGVRPTTESSDAGSIEPVVNAGRESDVSTTAIVDGYSDQNMRNLQSPWTAERIEVFPSMSIHEKLCNRDELFTLYAEYIIKTETTSDFFKVNVRVAEQAVTSQTTTSINGGRDYYVTEDLKTILVGDEAGVFALIAVDFGGTVNGIVQKGLMKAVNFMQDGNGGKVS